MPHPRPIAAPQNFSRRQFLRGAGACLALPAFESLLPAPLLAAETPTAALAATATGAPLRLAFVYFPNGAIHETWWPKSGEGADFAFNRTMEALEPLKSRVQVFSGLDHKNATGGKDGPGDHARANGTFLTGVRMKKTAGADIHAGVSIDQAVAQRVGCLTRFKSLELTCDRVRKAGFCDSGYSCAYQFNLSWQSPTTPVTPEPNPRLVFERMFGAGPSGERSRNQKLRQAQQRSILDFVLDDAQRLRRELGQRDRQKLDEFLVSLREVEQRIAAAEHSGDAPDPDVETPAGIPAEYSDHLRLMFDLMLLAFQTDSTRLATFLMAHDGSNRSFRHIGVSEGHHELSHHQNNRDMIDKLSKIDRWYVQQFAAFLERLEQTKDIDGQSLLHNSMIVYGSGNSDGNRHTHHDLPIILAGAGGGSLTPGRYVKMGSIPLSNLYLSLADRMGAGDLERFGDSTGRAPTI